MDEYIHASKEIDTYYSSMNETHQLDFSNLEEAMNQSQWIIKMEKATALYRFEEIEKLIDEDVKRIAERVREKIDEIDID